MSGIIIGEQLHSKLPQDIWNLILDNCVENDLHFYVSRKLLSKVLAVVSKQFNQIVKKAKVKEAVPDVKCLVDFQGLAKYCCQEGYASLLKYALDNGCPLIEHESSVASENGHVECLKVLADHGCQFNNYTLDKAVRHGQLEVIKYLDSVNRLGKITNQTILHAVVSGNVEMLKLISEKKKIEDYKPFGHFAAQSGSLEMVKYIEQFAPLDQEDVAVTAQKGNVEVLQYFIDKGFSLNVGDLCATALNNGHIDFFKFALRHGAPVDLTTMTNLATYNDVDLIREVRSKGCPWNSQTARRAAAFGNLEVLKYLIENGCPTVEAPTPQPFIGFVQDFSDLTLAAARGGHVACLQYLLDRGEPCPKDIINKLLRQQVMLGAFRGTNVVKYLHERGFEWDANSTAAAAAWGSLELLKYMRKAGCPWDATCCTAAAERSQIACLKYALDNGCEWDHRTMDKAAASCSLDTLKYLLERGIPWSVDTCTVLVKRGQLDLLQFAHENGAPWASDTIAIALQASFPSSPCLKYAIEHGCPCDPNQALAVAQLPTEAPKNNTFMWF